MNTLPTNTTRFIPVWGCKPAFKSSSVRPDLARQMMTFCDQILILFVRIIITDRIFDYSCTPLNDIPLHCFSLKMVQTWSSYSHMHFLCFWGTSCVLTEAAFISKYSKNDIVRYNITPLLQFKTTVFLFYYSLKCNLFLRWQRQMFRNHKFQKSLLIIFNNQMLI